MKSMVLVLVFLISTTAFAEEKKKVVKFRKVQNVSFDGEDVNGVVRNPMSSYLLQNKTLQFLPLYKVKQKVDQDIVQTLEALR